MRIDELPDVLVLGAGGTLGVAWLRGVLAGIEAAHGMDFRRSEYFVGTSAGSVVAASLAAGRRPLDEPPVEVPDVTAEEEPESAGRFAAKLASGARAARSAGAAATVPLAPLALAATAPGGRVARALLLKAVPHTGRRLDALGGQLRSLDSRFDGRLRVTAVDRRAGRRVVFGAPGAPPARVDQAVLASCAVPWLFDPVTIEGREYLDGGLWSPTNLDVAPAGRGSQVLCLVPTASRRARSAQLGALRAFTRAGALREAQALQARGARVRLLAPDSASAAAMGTRLMDGSRRSQVEAAAYAQGLRL